MSLLSKLSGVWSGITGKKEQEARKRREFELAHRSAEEYLFLLFRVRTGVDVRCCWSGDNRILCDEASKLCGETDSLLGKATKRLREIEHNIEITGIYPDDPGILFKEALREVKTMIGRLRPYADAETFISDIATYRFVVSTMADPSSAPDLSVFCDFVSLEMEETHNEDKTLNEDETYEEWLKRTNAGYEQWLKQTQPKLGSEKVSGTFSGFARGRKNGS